MPDIGTMHQLNPEPLHTGEIITPQAQAEEYAREAQESADNAALSAAAAQSAAETAQQAVESIAPALDEKAAARKKYHESTRKYDWHKMKVQQILRNLAFFQSFIGNAVPYDENTVTLDIFDHDAEHTEFYHLKVFRG